MPTYKTPAHFPGIPKPVQGLVEAFFPPDELPTPAIAPFPPNMMKEAGMATLKQIRTLPTLSGLGNDAVSALTMLQSRYPRTFGAVIDVGMDKGDNVPAFAQRLGEQLSYKGNPFSKINLARDLPFEDATNVAAHELTHAAQQLRKPKVFTDLYQEANKVAGYSKNPFEVQARKAGENFANRVANPKIKPGPSDMPSAAQMTQEYMDEAYPGNTFKPWAGLQQIRSLLGF